jgi:hypothetical protein
MQRCTNPGLQFARVTTICTSAPNVSWSSVQLLLRLVALFCIYNFEMTFRFLENLCIHLLVYKFVKRIMILFYYNSAWMGLKLASGNERKMS